MGSRLTWPERAFAAWMAPRGIVAASTASAFGLGLAAVGLPGAEQILPIVFVVIFGTVVLYGLTAGPRAPGPGWPGGGARSRSWSGRTMLGAPDGRGARARRPRGAGVGRARPTRPEAARAEGLTVRQGGLVVEALALEAELEEVHDVLLLTGSDAFNALAAHELRAGLARGATVYRLRPGRRLAGGRARPRGRRRGVRARAHLRRAQPALRRRRPARRVRPEAAGGAPALFVITADGALRVAAGGAPPDAGPGDRVIVLA